MNTELKEFIEANSLFNWKPNPLEFPKDLWKSNWPYVTFEKTIDPLSVERELNSINEYFVEHRSQDSYKHSGWSSVALHGIEYDRTENWDKYGFKSQEEANYKWTMVCNKIPYVTNIIKSLPFVKLGRVRIMRLAPGGYVMPHTDGTGRVFGPFNFALTQPIGCKFVFEGFGTVPFAQGRGCMLDLGVRHAVYNDSDQYRYHAIIHGHPTKDFYPGMLYSISQL
jgi:hypothetical protein